MVPFSSEKKSNVSEDHTASVFKPSKKPARSKQTARIAGFFLGLFFHLQD
jgi:hypothetical protein